MILMLLKSRETFIIVYTKIFYSNTDNKLIWKIMKPFFNGKGVGNDKITLIECDNIVSEEIAQMLNNVFRNAVSS